MFVLRFVFMLLTILLEIFHNCNKSDYSYSGRLTDLVGFLIICIRWFYGSIRFVCLSTGLPTYNYLLIIKYLTDCLIISLLMLFGDRLKSHDLSASELRGARCVCVKFTCTSAQKQSHCLVSVVAGVTDLVLEVKTPHEFFTPKKIFSLCITYWLTGKNNISMFL